MKDLKTRLDEDLNRYSYTKAKGKFKPENFGKVTLKPLEVVKGNKISCVMVLLIIACAIILASPIMTTMYKTIEKFSLQPVALEKKFEKHLESLPNNIEVKGISYFSKQIVFSITHSSKRYKNEVKDSPISIKKHFINSNVQVHNLTENKITQSYHEEGIEFITKLDYKTVAATFKNRIELWRITEHQSHIARTVTYTLNTAGQYCSNIHYRVGNLFVMYIDFESRQFTIKQLNIYGYEVTSFSMNFNYFTEMTVSPDGKTIYISYSHDNSVKSYTPEGELMAEYRNDSLSYPRKMTVDRIGNLFITGIESKNIFYISPELTHGYELIHVTDIWSRDSITYNEIDNSLYIGSIKDRSLKVFKIKT
jgi:hypothetical protein